MCVHNLYRNNYMQALSRSIAYRQKYQQQCATGQKLGLPGAILYMHNGTNLNLAQNRS